MKRPLVPLALGYTGGILLAESLQPPLTLIFAAAFACALAALLISKFRATCFWLLVVCCGWANLSWRTAVVSPFDLRATQGSEPKLVTIRGVLAQKPDLRVRPAAGEEEEFARTLAVVDATELRELAAGGGTEWGRAHGRVLVNTYGRLGAEFGAGTQVEVTGILGLPPSALAEGLFDYREYLKRQGIYYQLKVERSAEWTAVSGTGKGPPLSERFLAWAQKTLARGLPEEDEPLRLLWAMTLGWKTGMSNEVYEPFMKSGTMHIFAISGLHIALIAAVLVSLLRVLQVPRGWCGLVSIPLIWFYTGATGWQPSAIRSALMMTVVIGGWALRRPSDLVNSLAAAGFIILLWEPRQLFGASFQLSFFVVLSIALLVPPVQEWVERRLQTDPFLPVELLPRGKRRLVGLARWLVPGVATSVAAWLGAWPLTLHYFHLVSWVTLPVNVLVVPLSGLALASNLGSLLCGSWLPGASELFNHSAWFWMLCMVRLSEWACLAPAGYRYAPALCAPGLVVYYALLIAVTSGWVARWVRGAGAGADQHSEPAKAGTPNKATRRAAAAWRRGAVAAAGVLVALVLAWHLYAARRVATLTVLPLSGGMCLVCKDHSGWWVADPGRTNSVRYTLAPFLHARGVNAVPKLFLTHGDTKHVAGAELFAEQFAVRDVVVPDVRFRSTVYRRVVARLEGGGQRAEDGGQRTEGGGQKSMRVRRVGYEVQSAELGVQNGGPARGDVQSAGSGVGNEGQPNRSSVVSNRVEWNGWRVLHPVAGERYGRADDGALVLSGTLHGTRILIVSDLGEEGQRMLLERGCDLRADVVVSGLPSTGEALGDKFLDAVEPKVVVIGDSETPTTERAGFELRERLKSRGMKVLYTSECGAMTLRCWKGGSFECKGRF